MYRDCAGKNGAAAPIRQRAGFTLVEVLLVAVLIAIISGISLPYFSGSYRGNKLRTAGRTIVKMARYARSMAIMREKTLVVALNPHTMELFAGEYLPAPTNTADGELDQDVLKRLGYIEDDEKESTPNGGIEKEIYRFLPNGLRVGTFEKKWIEEHNKHEELYTIQFYPDGQCEEFKIELEDRSGLRIRLENDLFSEKIRSEFMPES